jgi:hypothetical protein
MFENKVKMISLFIAILMAVSAGYSFAKMGEGFNLVLSPQFGFVRFAEKQGGQGPDADDLVATDGWSLGGLIHGIHPRFIFEVYPFYAKLDEIKTIGDIAYLDVYPYKNGNFSLNAGFGLVTIFNRTDDVDTNIISPFPLFGVKYKFGKYGSYINPWVGFMYDMIDVNFENPHIPDQEERNKSFLIGSRLGYKPLPFLNLVFKFYYKYCFEDVEKKSTITLTNRNVIYFTENIGATSYLDYRQYTSGGYMLMFVGGPAFVF